MAFFVGALANVFTTGWNWPVGLSLGVLVLVWVFWEVRRAAHLTAGLSPVAADTATVGPERIRSAGVAIVPMRSGFDETGPQPLADLNPPSPGGGSQRGSWPHQVGIVPNPADCYRHREITDQLSPDATEWISGTQILSGMGGVGKSQLAAAVVRHYWNSGQVDLAVWLNAGSRAAIIAGYAQAGVETTAGDGHNEEACARRFLAWLARTSRRWIIVLDDLNEPSDLGGWWPPLSPQGRVLVTTRRRDATLRGRGTLIDVGMFSPAEAVGYLRQKLGEPHERTEPIARLAEDVGFLPLALAQAAAYIVDRGIDCAAYRSRFANQSLRLSELLPEPSALPDDHRDVLAVTWSLSVDAANQLDPPGLARPLLLVLSLGDPNGLPLAVLHCPPVLGFFGEARGTDRPATADEASDALHCLYRLNLATPVNIQQHRAVQVHGLVQRASREQAPPAQLDGAARALALALVESWPDVEADAVLGRLLRVTTASLHRHAPDVLWSDEQRELLFRYGRSLGEAGAVAPASDYFRRMATDALRRLGPEHPATLRARSRSAGWRGRAGDPAGAANAFEELLGDHFRVLGTDHPDTLRARGSLARWRGQAGDPAGAAAAAHALLADCVRVLGTDHPDTLRTRGNVIRWRGQAGDPAGAASASAVLIDDCTRILGGDHPDTLSVRNYMARWHGEAGDPQRARHIAEQVLADYSRVLGDDHPDTLNVLGNRARWLGESGDPSGAVAAYQEVLARRLAVLGADHPDTLTARNNVAFWRAQAGGVTAAAADVEELLLDYLRLLGPDHPATLGVRVNLAFLRGEAGDPGAAHRDCATLVDDYLRVLGPDHPETLGLRCGLARWRGEAGDPRGAVDVLEPALPDFGRVLGWNHVATLTARGMLAYLRGLAGDAAGAADGYEDLLTDRIRVLGAEHPDTVSTRKNLAFWRQHG